MADRENLERLIGVVEGKLADLGAFPADAGMDAWDEWRAREQAMATELAALHRASIGRHPGDGYRMMMGGVSTTCTSGRAGLLRNWVNAARRRIEAGAS